MVIMFFHQLDSGSAWPHSQNLYKPVAQHWPTPNFQKRSSIIHIIPHFSIPPKQIFSTGSNPWIKTMIKRCRQQRAIKPCEMAEKWPGHHPMSTLTISAALFPVLFEPSKQTSQYIKQLGFLKMGGLVPLYDNIIQYQWEKWWQMEWNELSIAILFSIKTITRDSTKATVPLRSTRPKPHHRIIKPWGSVWNYMSLSGK